MRKNLHLRLTGSHSFRRISVQLMLNLYLFWGLGTTGRSTSACVRELLIACFTCCFGNIVPLSFNDLGSKYETRVGHCADSVVASNNSEAGPDPFDPCKRSKLFAAHTIVAWSTNSKANGFFYKSGLTVDADGAFQACHPRDRLGLDSLVHAGRRGNWWALVTDGKPNGHPVVQGRSDPAPGYISMTALCDSENPNPRDRVEPINPSHKCLNRMTRQPSWGMPRKLAS